MGAGRRAKRILGRFLGGLPKGQGTSGWRIRHPTRFVKASITRSVRKNIAKIALLFESELALGAARSHVVRKHGSTVTRALFFDLDSRSSD
jgi:hypothetical protein